MDVLSTKLSGGRLGPQAGAYVDQVFEGGKAGLYLV